MDKRVILRLGVIIAIFTLVGLLFLSVWEVEENTTNVSNSGVELTTVTVAMPSLGGETFLNWNGGSGRKFYLDTIYDYLVYIDPDSQQLLPGLAESWETSADGKEIRLQLRKDIVFHQGWGPLTASDVKFSIERSIALDSRAGPASTLRPLIKDIEIISDTNLVIRLTRLDIGFVGGFLSNGQQLSILSQHYINSVGEQQANQQPIGSGNFQLLSHQRGSAIHLQSVNSHWRHTPTFEQLVFLSVPDESTRVAMLQAGEVDIAPISYDAMAKLRNKGFQIFTIHQNWAPVIRFGGIVSTNSSLHNPNVPWADTRVRQALNYAIDKQVIVDAIFHGEAQVAGMDFPAPEWRHLQAYPYDPARARELLQAAGYEEGFNIRLNTFASSPGADLPLVAEVVAQYWQAIGLRVQVVPVDWTSLRGAIASGKATDSLWTHRGLPFFNTAVGLNMSTSADSIFATFSNQHTQALLNELDQAVDRHKRQEIITTLGRYLHEQAAAVYIAYANEPFGLSQRIGDWPRISDHLTNFDQISLQ